LLIQATFMGWETSREAGRPEGNRALAGRGQPFFFGAGESPENPPIPWS
jgi:hypothetical protein